MTKINKEEKLAKIIKRNGMSVDYDGGKIISAISRAMNECGKIDLDVISKIETYIRKSITDREQSITVEIINDLVEVELMNNKLYDVAKRFILYRDERLKSKASVADYKYKHLTKEFLDKYKKTSEPFNTLGSFVFYRTYSRYLNDKGRREKWVETVARTVDYNCSLAPTSQKEAERMFDNMFYLKQTLSGRAMWSSPIDGKTNSGLSFFNCSASVINDFEDILDGFYLLLVGAGFGFRVMPDDVVRFPRIKRNVELISQNYSPKLKGRQEYTTTEHYSKDMIVVHVGDSREGWIEGLRILFQIYTDIKYKTVDTIVFNYDNIRGPGLPIKGFGGKASGARPYIDMIESVNKILSKTDKLKTIDIVDIMNLIGVCVVSGNVRRSSEICLFDKTDKEILDAKSELYKVKDGEWIIDKNLMHRQMSNNTIMYHSKPTREELHEHVNKMRYSGEPGFSNLEAMKKKHKDAELLNPCFTGDMKLLTVDGYKTFAELDGSSVDVVSYDGTTSTGKVWCTGEKNILELSLSNGEKIKCTPNHRFMLTNGDECEAKDLLDKRVSYFKNKSTTHIDEYVKYGFIQGDGTLGRLKSETHKGVEVNIGEKDSDVLALFAKDRYTTFARGIYLQDIKDTLIGLGFSSEQLPNRTFPSTYKTWTIAQKLSFIKGCYSANGCVVKNHRIQYKTTSLEFANQMIEALLEFGISTNLTTNKPKLQEFSNGEYECKESYDICINKFTEIVKFYEKIGFVHNYKNESLLELINSKSPKVTKIVDKGIDVVYDFSEPNNHWGVVNGVVAHNCAEILILDNKGLCNLTTVNMLAFVDDDGNFNKEELLEAQRLSARAGYRVTCLDLELPQWDYNQKKHRSLGCSLSGIQDFVNATKMSEDDFAKLLQELRFVAVEEGKKYAKEIGGNEPSLTTTIKPAGSSSQLFGESSGIHYSHSPYFIRRVRVSVNDPLLKVAEDIGLTINNEVGQSEELGNLKTKVVDFYCKSPEGKTKYDSSAIEQLEFYKLVMKNYIDHNISVTVHVRDSEWDGVEQWLWDNWDEVIAISFMSLDDSFYQLLPYESITKEQYEEKKHLMKDKFTTELINKYEKIEYKVDEDELEADCSSGACKLR